MRLLSWDGVDGSDFRDVLENMHHAAALTEMLGALLRMDGHRDEYAEDIALELVFDAGALGQALGQRALELLDAQAAPEAPTSTRVRPDTAAHVAGADPSELAVGDLVPVGETPAARGASSARPLVLFALALVVLAVLVALVAPGRPEPPPAEGLRLGGRDATGGGAVRLDLAEPVEVVLPPEAPSGPVSLRLSALGLSLAEGSAAQTVVGAPLSIDLSDSHYLVAGRVRAEVTVGTARYETRVDPAGGGVATVPGAGAVLVALLALAWAEALLRPLRRGRRTPGAPAALAAVGALFGAAVGVLGWAFGSAETAWAALLLCAALGGGAGVVAGEAAGRTAAASGAGP